VLVIEVLVVAGLLFAIAAVAAGFGDRLVDAERDAPDIGLPDDRPPTASDVEQLRFRRALRGYRMADVDLALDRLADTLRERGGEDSSNDDGGREPAEEPAQPAEHPTGRLE
jgi:DivIVA domain-containing protein